MWTRGIHAVRNGFAGVAYPVSISVDGQIGSDSLAAYGELGCIKYVEAAVFQSGFNFRNLSRLCLRRSFRPVRRS